MAAALLYGSTLIWFYLFHGYLIEEILPSSERLVFVLGKFLFYGSVVVFGILGCLASQRIERRKFLVVWTVIGFFSTISLVAFQGLAIILVQSLFLGISFGLGFPTCQLFLARYTSIENRGRRSGIVVSVSFLVLVLILLMAEPGILNLGLTGLVWVCAGLKLVSVIALLIDPFKMEPTEKGKTWTYVLTSNIFVAYLVPWLIFQISNGILLFMGFPFDTAPVENSAFVLEFLGVLSGAFISGYLADYVGRRQPILVGLLFLGSCYALMGLVVNETSWLLVNIAGGFAWGLITVAYMQVVLGDLAIRWGSEEKTFALGGIAIPIFIYTVFAVVRAEFSEISIPANLLSSLLSILLFACVIPILRVKETADLSERKMKDHLKKVGELVEDSIEKD